MEKSLRLGKVSHSDREIFPDKIWSELSVLVSLSQTRWMFQKPPGLSVRSVRSTSPTKWHSTRRARILCMPRESGIMTGNRVAMVGRLSRFSGKRLKLQRRLYWGLNVLSPTVDWRECWLSRDASILSWEAIRRERAKWSSFELHILFNYEDNKNAISKILLFMLKKKPHTQNYILKACISPFDILNSFFKTF